MKKTYEITYSNKATINTGNYENLNPMYATKKIIETEGSVDIIQEFAEMKKIVDGELYKSIQEIQSKDKQKTLEHLRIKVIDGISYPSVTTIITPDKPDIPNLELYGLRGNMWDGVFKKMVEEGKYEPFFTVEELKQIEPIGGMAGHSLEWVMKDDRFDFRQAQVEVINKKDIYCGTYDADGFYELLAIFDCKSGKINKQMIEKAFMQMSAYCMAKEEIPQRMVIVPTQDTKPIISDDVEGYYKKFMVKRVEFKERFGI